MFLEVKDLNIFRIEDEEEHFIVAENKEDAIKYFFSELNFNDIQEYDLKIREIQKDEDIQVNLNTDDDLLLELINKYRVAHERMETISIWDLIKYNLLKDKLQDRKIEIPYVICSSIFS